MSVLRPPLSRSFVDLGLSPLANAYVAEETARPGAVLPAPRLRLRALLPGAAPRVRGAGEIFSDYAYFSSYSDTWLAHARRTSRDDRALRARPASHVVEIASNDGYLLQYFVERGIPVLGIEPAAQRGRGGASAGHPDRWSRSSAPRRARAAARRAAGADLLVGNNVLAHVPTSTTSSPGCKILLDARRRRSPWSSRTCCG